MGNPPYSVGQDSANDDNANTKYPTIDTAIRDTYASRSTATNKNSLYDSYIRAIKWASLRIRDRGVIAFVTNGGFIDANTTDGLRQTLAEEFSTIHVLNLRGNQRTAGEQSRKEGGKVFGGGSRATVAITVLVKNPDHTDPATIHYTDIGDYMTRAEKLAHVAKAGGVLGLDAATITPNEHGDWVNKRQADVDRFMPVGDKERSSIFAVYSGGLKTNRDAWCYGATRSAVDVKIRRLLAAYDTDRARGARTEDPTQISWNRGLIADHSRSKEHAFRPDAIVPASYRPFTRQMVYFDRGLNDMIYRLPRMFPTPANGNVGFYALNPGAEKPFSVLMLSLMPDLAFYGSNAGQFFSRWTWEPVDDEVFDFGVDGDVVAGYRRIDNITDEALSRFSAAYGVWSKDDAFYYCYALLHSSGYRETYAADLRKMLPRIPLVADAADARAFADAGRRLSDLHIGYESVQPYPLDGLRPTGAPEGEAAYDYYAVGDKKMRFGKPTLAQKAAGERADRTVIRYNERITLSGIPEEAHRYQLGARSGIEWIIDRYYVRTDKVSGIVNDPNDWSREVSDPRYILDLLARIVTVSVETVKIVDALPALRVREKQNTDQGGPR